MEYSDSNNNKQISNKKEKANSREREREMWERQTMDVFLFIVFISEDSDSLGNTRIFVFGWISIRIVYLVCTQIQLFS